MRSVPCALILVALHPEVVAFVTLRRWLPAHANLCRGALKPGGADGEVVGSLEMHRDLRRPEERLLAQPQELLHDLDIGRLRLVVRGAMAITGPLETLPPRNV